MVDRNNFDAESTTDEVLEGIDLSGKTAFVTGGASGLGTETTRALASKGAHVIIAARDVRKGDKAAKKVREATGGEVDVVELDLASLESERWSLARKWSPPTALRCNLA